MSRERAILLRPLSSTSSLKTMLSLTIQIGNDHARLQIKQVSLSPSGVDIRNHKLFQGCSMQNVRANRQAQA